HGIGLAINLFTKEGDRILVPSPTYRPFRMLVEFNGRVFGDHPLGYDNGKYYLDKERFEKDASESSMILFCSPHNPSGLVFTEDELKFVLETGKKYNIPVISDEIHSDLVHPNAHHTPMGKANEGIGAKVITLMAPSKTFNVAGEHSAIILFSDSDMQKTFQEKQQGLWLTEPGFLIGELTQVCYQDGLEYNLELCAYLEGNAELAKHYLEDHVPGVRMVDGKASFVTFLDCSGIYEKVKKEVEGNPEKYQGGNGGGILSRFFGVNAGIAMNDGTWFGEQYKEFCRFNYGTTRDRVLDALKRIEKAVKSLG
ncbi:MAG: aminotransferase class I/II-fold pyridoxal phosphate-dependent enzyme, partial [Spirochaetales bacterium]|nr:aminotransferase class I/II-fold pyridoxal phosphate-dependent enzyme [Candidatus Physcosoma equi]